MLGIVAMNGARLSAGSVGLSVARRWSEAGQRVLFIDADASGPPLSERFGAAIHTEYNPEIRGLPSLIAAREPLTLKLAADHSYNLDVAGGSRWALFAPSHPQGTRYATRWLFERLSDLMDIDRERNIILASSLQAGEDPQISLLRAMPVLVVVAPMDTPDDAAALRAQCEASGLLGADEGGPPKQRLLIIDGKSPDLGDNEAMGIAGLYVGGRLPAIEDEKLLRLQGSRKDRAFLREFDRIAEYLLQLPDRGSGSADEIAPVSRPDYAVGAEPSYSALGGQVAS